MSRAGLKSAVIREVCGGHRGLAHPRSQDSLLPTRHLLINTETHSRVKWLVGGLARGVHHTTTHPPARCVFVVEVWNYVVKFRRVLCEIRQSKLSL